MTGWLGRAASAVGAPRVARTVRAPRSRRTAYRLRVARRVLAAALVAVAVWTTLEQLRPPPPAPGRAVVLAARDVAAGTTLRADDLTLASLGAGAADVTGLDRLDAAIGRVLDSPLAAGEVLSRTRFRGSDLLTGMPSGQLAVAVPVANAPIVAALAEGDRVTLVGTSDGATVEAVVLSLPRDATASGGVGLGGSALASGTSVNHGGATPLIVAVAASAVSVVAQELGRSGASAGFVVALHSRS
jgi:hypothetical protein